MEKNPFKWPIAVLAGILICCTDIFFNIPAALLWPEGGFSPLKHFHSELGATKPHPIRGTRNSELGAQFYNCGQVFQGLAIILFAGGLYIFYMEDKWKDIFLKLGQISGFLLGFATILNGIFSADFQPQHGQISEILFLGIILSEFFINGALIKNPKFWKPIGYLGFIAGCINLFFLFTYEIFYPFFLMEYIAVYTAETWLALITINIFYNEVWSKE